MSSILLISTIYPIPNSDNQGTPVCHYFAREWVKMGHNVRVVHYQAVYLAPFYWLARINRKKIVAKTGAIVYKSRDKGAIFEMDGVPINRIPLYKPIPHGKFSARAIRRSIDKIVTWNKESSFIPDVIVGHFPNPQIEVVGQLKTYYSKAKTAIVMHGDIELAKKVYGDRLLSLTQKIDCWGFRNRLVKDSFERKVIKVNNSFICYSGIPGTYITTANTHLFTHPINRFVYVGTMIERKYPLSVMDALQIAYPDSDYELTYVGEGHLLEIIKARIQSYGIEQRVRLLGKIPRDSIKEQYDAADCMVMISRSEAYGLVYLEAMARGCITIASRNEGFDGIIQDGVNGFLCKAGDFKELAAIIKRIKSIPQKKLQEISEAAIATARWLTDVNAATMYLEDITKPS